MKFVFDTTYVNSLLEAEKSAKLNGSALTFSLGDNANAKDFKTFTTNFMFEISRFMEFFDKLPDLMSKLDQHIKNHDQLLNEYKKVKAKVVVVEEDLELIKTENSARDVTISSLEGKVETHEKLIADLRRDMEKSTTLLDNTMKELKLAKSKNVSLERHSRSFNLRLLKLKEKPNEKTPETIKMINECITEVTGLNGFQIEYGHRSGKKSDDEPRVCIFRPQTRQDKFALLNRRKDFFDAGYQLYEDLPYEDIIEKKKWAKEIDVKYKANHRVAFRQGSWWVDGAKFSG